MKIHTAIFTILSGLVFFAPVSAQTEDNLCRNGLFPKEEVEFRLAKIKGAKNERAYFYGDENDCPTGKNCQKKSYLIAGDEVIVSKNFGRFSCVWYQPKKGSESVDWILTEKLEFAEVNKNPSSSAWIGEWRYYDNSINIVRGAQNGELKITGNAFWRGLGDNIHIGEIDDRAKPSGNLLKIGEESDDEYECRAVMRLVGRYLIASDNMQCGGANVTFSGVYLKK